MDEATIAAQLAARLEEPTVIEEAPKPPATPEAGDPDVLKDPEVLLDATVAKAHLMEFFEVPGWARSAPEVEQRVSTILDWAREEAGSQDLADILRVINDQITVMGIRHGEERMSRLVQFVRIRAQRKLLEQKERGLYDER